MTVAATVLPTLTVKSWPRHNTKEEFPPVLLEEALLKKHPKDAQFCVYRILGREAIPRLSKSAEDLGLEIEMHLIAADIDREPHEPWDSLGQAKSYLMEALAICPFASGYTTRRGIRLIWVLETPVPILKADETIRRWYRILEQRGLNPDPACAHWSRTYRLPNVTVWSEGKRTTREGYVDCHALRTNATLSFNPKIVAKKADVVPVSNPMEIHPDGMERAICERLNTDPTSRQRYGVWLVGEDKVSGNRVFHIPCPSCREESVWYLVSIEKDRHKYARCNHQESCGWWGHLIELRGAKNA